MAGTWDSEWVLGRYMTGGLELCTLNWTQAVQAAPATTHKEKGLGKSSIDPRDRQGHSHKQHTPLPSLPKTKVTADRAPQHLQLVPIHLSTYFLENLLSHCPSPRLYNILAF